MNWHEPAITAAQAAYAFGGVFLLNTLMIFLFKPRNSPGRVKPDTEEEVTGDGSLLVRDFL